MCVCGGGGAAGHPNPGSTSRHPAGSTPGSRYLTGTGGAPIPAYAGVFSVLRLPARTTSLLRSPLRAHRPHLHLVLHGSAFPQHTALMTQRVGRGRPATGYHRGVDRSDLHKSGYELPRGVDRSDLQKSGNELPIEEWMGVTFTRVGMNYQWRSGWE